MPIDLNKFPKGKDFKSADFDFNDPTDTISIKTGPGSSVGDAITSAVGGVAGAPSPASETVAGIAKIATAAAVTAGTDDTSIVTPKKLKAAIAASVPTVADASDSTKGVVSMAVGSNFTTLLDAATKDDEATTPAFVKKAVDAGIAAIPAVTVPKELGTRTATTNGTYSLFGYVQKLDPATGLQEVSPGGKKLVVPIYEWTEPPPQLGLIITNGTTTKSYSASTNTWTTVSATYPETISDNRAINTGSSIIYAPSKSAGSNYLWRSTDMGATYTKVQVRAATGDNFYVSSFTRMGSTIIMLAQNVFAAATDAEKLFLFRSTDDGATWTNETLIPFSFATAGVVSNDGTKFIVGYQNLNNGDPFRKYVSTDGISWSSPPTTPSSTFIGYRVAGFVGSALAIGSSSSPNKIGLTTDSGANFTFTNPTVDPTAPLYDIRKVGSWYVALTASQGGSPYKAYKSQDLVTWTEISSTTGFYDTVSPLLHDGILYYSDSQGVVKSVTSLGVVSTLPTSGVGGTKLLIGNNT